MSKASGLLLALFVGLATLPVQAANPPASDDSAMLPMALKLRDGSLILGRMKDDKLPVVGDTIGAVNIPLSRIRLVKFGVDGKSDAITFKNGDQLKGDAQVPRISVETSFGRVSIAKGLLAELQVKSPSGSGQRVDWELLPFPKNSDWPGDRGERAEIEDDGSIILHGQPVLSKQTYSLPLTIECDVICPQPSEEDGGFTLAAYAPDQQSDMNAREALKFHFGYRKRGNLWGGLLCERVKDGDRGAIIWGEHRVKYSPGKTCHIRLTLTAESSRMELDAQKYDMEDVIVPYERFKIRLEGWRTTDPWRVQNFAVH